MTTGQAYADAIAASPTAGRYDRVVRLAQAIFGAPIAALNLIGEHQQHTVAAVGAPRQDAPLSESICRFTVEHDDVVEINDLRADERFRQYPIVAGPPRVRFYAGVPLHAANGATVGVLCILDLVPRDLGTTQREMLADLGAIIERELAVQEEMAKAGQVQRLLLPSGPPDLPGLEVAGRVLQARAAGGDFFDWQVLPGTDGADQLHVLLADVMGKGLAASLIASEMRAVLRTHGRYVGVAEAVRRSAATTARDLASNGSFVTLWSGRVDPRTGGVEYVDAGHGLGAIASPRGARRLTQEQLPLGMPVDTTWTSARDVLTRDELLVVVSDGVFDVLGSVEKALVAVQALLEPRMSCAEVVDRIVAYAAERGTSDDVAAVVVRRTEGSQASPPRALEPGTVEQEGEQF